MIEHNLNFRLKYTSESKQTFVTHTPATAASSNLFGAIKTYNAEKKTMDNPSHLTLLARSHREIQKLNLVEWGCFENLSHLCIDPFDDKNLPGDFIYSSNKIIKRYSPMYKLLDDESYIFQNCKMDTGYTALIVCEKLGSTKGEEEISFNDFVYTSEGQMLENNFCVFQNPYTKLFHHGPHDILKICSTHEQANEFALRFTDSEGISTLIARVKFHINWH